MTKELSATVARSLNERPIAWVTTLRPDGSPHTTPTWFVFRQSCIWIASGKRNRKVIHLFEDSRVSIAIDGSGSSPLVAQARAAVVEIDAAPQIVLTGFAEKYDCWDVRDASLDGERVLLKMSVQRWLFGA